jgi:predicted SAM-dependent methyltransferase
MTKLHLGCGKRDFGTGWVHIDSADFSHIKYKDVTNLSQYRNDSVDVIYASHLIAYFDREQIVMILNEWKRVLRKGGILRLATPDFKKMSELFSKSEITLDEILGPLYGRMQMNDKTIFHKTTYDFHSLAKLLNEIGFKDPVRYNWKVDTDHAEHDDHSQAYLPHMDKENGVLISLNVQAIKA